jgi:hypothetical protein
MRPDHCRCNCQTVVPRVVIHIMTGYLTQFHRTAGRCTNASVAYNIQNTILSCRFDVNLLQSAYLNNTIALDTATCMQGATTTVATDAAIKLSIR